MCTQVPGKPALGFKGGGTVAPGGFGINFHTQVVPQPGGPALDAPDAPDAPCLLPCTRSRVLSPLLERGLAGGASGHSGFFLGASDHQGLLELQAVLKLKLAPKIKAGLLRGGSASSRFVQVGSGHRPGGPAGRQWGLCAVFRVDPWECFQDTWQTTCSVLEHHRDLMKVRTAHTFTPVSCS